MSCCFAQPRRCSRPPRRVQIGEKPFRIKQMSWRSGSAPGRCFHWDEDWLEEGPFEGDYFPGDGFLPPPPTPFPPGPDEPGIERGAGAPFPPGPMPFPGCRPRHFGRRCPPCNLRIKVRRLDACGRAAAGVVIGLFSAGRLIRTVTTNARGQGTFSHLFPGMYEVRELEVPSGLTEDPTRYAVFLNRQCTSATVVLQTGECIVDCPDLSRWWPENPHHG